MNSEKYREEPQTRFFSDTIKDTPKCGAVYVASDRLAGTAGKIKRQENAAAVDWHPKQGNPAEG